MWPAGNPTGRFGTGAGRIKAHRRAMPSAVNREIALTAADSRDRLEATVIGANCETATLFLTLRKADGALLWTHSIRATDTWAFVPAE